MSEFIKHECGLAVIRLLKPIEHYQQKYGTAFYGIEKLRLLLQKQRNRGQDGAGMATIKIDPKPGTKYISRKRVNSKDYINDLFKEVYKEFSSLTKAQRRDVPWLKAHTPYIGELLMGHLRYGTHSDYSIETCHPFWRANNWISRNLILAGNFNLTNVDELFDELVDFGQYPTQQSDTVTVLEKIGHFLDDEVHRLHTWFKPDGHSNIEINKLIFDNLDVQRLLRRASKEFDGGYVIGGMIGHGDAFVMRDPAGIRPAFYYHDEEVVVAASERPAIQTAFDVHISKIKEVSPGHALIVKYGGEVTEKPFIASTEKRPCSFERIYFSRGTDRDIYLERKKLGEQLTNLVLEAIDYDFDHTVFSFIPNTAESAFLGLIKGVEQQLNQIKKERILQSTDNLKEDNLKRILEMTPRVEKIVVKDEKLRTFIADTNHRHDMVSHVYDVTYGIVENYKDNLVLVDDSIVRGTTMKNSILRIVSRLKPRSVIIVSSAPQIRYPDCYGIDMSKMNEFIAFQALLSLLEESGQLHLLQQTYQQCKEQELLPVEKVVNQVAPLYDTFTYQQVSDKIADLLKPKDIDIEVKVIFQTIDGLHHAIPLNSGDWYFSGRYPTPGGNRVVNRAFINFMENKNQRAY